MKNELRKLSLEKRKHLNIDLYSKKIINLLFSLNEYKCAKNILCYYPLKYEVQTIKCIEDKTKNIFLPRVVKNDLEICKYDKENLCIGCFNIMEANQNIQPSTEKMEIVIIPAVAADINGYRIGYGKGFYDRFFQKLGYNPLKIMLLFSDCLYENTYPESFDVKADIIITEKNILKI